MEMCAAASFAHNADFSQAINSNLEFDEGLNTMNTKIAIAVIAGCLVVAGIITLMMSKSGDSTQAAYLKGKTVWLQCTNPDCADVYEILELDYNAALEKQTDFSVPLALKCQKCRKDTAIRVHKCEQCGNVWPYGPGKFGDYADRCPKCGVSKTEQTSRSGG
jgi:hypothetical protein